MHIPNGLLDPKVSAGASFVAAGALGYCIAKVRQALSAVVPEAVLAGAGSIAGNVSDRSKKLISSFAENHLMRMGAIGSLIFASQMFNFPVNSGTSGHLLGGVIAAITLGPFSGSIVIAAVLTVQSIFFADGGIMALGANILNMAIIGTFASYYIYYAINKAFKNKVGFYSGAMLAGFFSVVSASAACAVEIAMSGSMPIDRVLPAMVSVHSVIGLAEALLTVIVLEILMSMNFELEGQMKDE